MIPPSASDGATPARPPRETLIEARRGLGRVDVRELAEYRDLLWIFVWKNVKVRYKQTAIGVTWAVVQPVLTMVVFTLFFGRWAGMPSDGAPYPVFYLSAVVVWTYFAQSLTGATGSLVDQEHMLRKVYFPRLLLPVAAVISAGFDLGIALVVMTGVFIAYGSFPNAHWLAVPAAVALAATTALGSGLGLGALNVKFRDVRQAVPFVVQLWLFASPIAYPASVVPERWRVVYALNPLAGTVELFRWATTGRGSFPALDAAIGAFIAAALLVAGLKYFVTVERQFADIV